MPNITVSPKQRLPLWKVLFIVCPLTYGVALAFIALISFIEGRFTPTIMVLVNGQLIKTVTGELAYDWYAAIAIQTVALLHALFCFVLVWRYRNNTTSTLLKATAIVLTVTYLAFASYCAYRLAYPDPNIQPIIDNFRSR